MGGSEGGRTSLAGCRRTVFYKAGGGLEEWVAGRELLYRLLGLKNQYMHCR